MTFVYDNGIARNNERDVVVKPGLTFTDAHTGYFPLLMIVSGIGYEIDVTEYLDFVTFLFEGLERTLLQPVVYYILEKNFREKVAKARVKSDLPPVTPEEYQFLKNMAQEAIFCLKSRGGKTLEIIPNLRVDFIETLADKPPNKDTI
jgi:hypothetical protein